MADLGVDLDLAARARAWRSTALAAVCDVLEPWEHGTVARATRYPHYFDFNVVRVEDRPLMGVAELSAFADRALAGLSHERIDFDLLDAAEPLRAGFMAAGWRALRVLWMHHGGELPPAPDAAVEAVPYDDVRGLRATWLAEDFPKQDSCETRRFLDEAREAARQHPPEVLAVRDGGVPVAFAQLERHGAGAEVTEVYVHPGHRGRGLGRAVTAAAIRSAAGTNDLWIGADDDDWPKHLYAKLGFAPATRMMEFLRTARG